MHTLFPPPSPPAKIHPGVLYTTYCHNIWSLGSLLRTAHAAGSISLEFIYKISLLDFFLLSGYSRQPLASKDYGLLSSLIFIIRPRVSTSVLIFPADNGSHLSRQTQTALHEHCDIRPCSFSPFPLSSTFHSKPLWFQSSDMFIVTLNILTFSVWYKFLSRLENLASFRIHNTIIGCVTTLLLD